MSRLSFFYYYFYLHPSYTTVITLVVSRIACHTTIFHVGAPLLCNFTAILLDCTVEEGVQLLLDTWNDGRRLERKLGNIGQGESIRDVYKLVEKTNQSEKIC